LNKRHLTKASLNDVTSVIVTAVELDAAYQYSAKLSDRSTKGFTALMKKANRGEKVYFGGMMPSFITGVKNGKFTTDARRENLVKQIFAEYIAGKPMNRIAKDLNEANTPPLSLATGKLWAPFTIKTILRNAAYTGDFTYRHKTFPDYLPALVSKGDFKKVQYLLNLKASKRVVDKTGKITYVAKNGGTITGRGGSPTGRVNSIFNGIGKCICGASMVVVNSTRGKHHYSYYFCSAARAHACKKNTQGHLLKTSEVESHFLMHFLQDSPSGFIAKHTPQAIDESIGIKMQIADIDKAIGTAGELIRSGTAVNVIKAQLDKWEAEKKALEHQLQALSVKTMVNSQYPTASNGVKEAIAKFIQGGFIANDGKKIKLTTDGLRFVEAKMLEQGISDALNNNETRKKLKAILPLVVKEIRCDTTRNGYSVINHDGNESPFMSLAK
jgi:hypothetical protein